MSIFLQEEIWNGKPVRMNLLPLSLLSSNNGLLAYQSIQNEFTQQMQLSQIPDIRVDPAKSFKRVPSIGKCAHPSKILYWVWSLGSVGNYSR